MAHYVHIHDQIAAKDLSKQKLKAGLVEQCVRKPSDGNWNQFLPHSPFGNIVLFKHLRPNPLGVLDVGPGRLAKTQIEVTDRNFKAGDWAKKGGDVGQVQNVSVKADMLIVGTTIIALNIPTERLQQIEDFPEGSYILYNDWVGRVTRAIRMITVHVGTDDEEDPFVGVVDYRDSPYIYDSCFQNQCPAYPQQKLAGPWNALRNASWELVKKGKKQVIEENFQGRVAKVEVKFLEVQWRCFVGKPEDHPEKEPETRISENVFPNVKLLNGLNSEYFRLGSVRYFHVAPEDEFLYHTAWSTSTTEHPSKLPKPDMTKFMGERVSVQCYQTSTTVDVLWKDGSTETYNSVDLEPYEATEADFIRGDYVFKPNSEIPFGVVQSAQHKQKTVLVKWIDNNNQLLDHGSKEESATDIKVCGGYDYTPGNIACSSFDGLKTVRILECRADGQMSIKSHETGQTWNRLPIGFLPLYVDPRHMNPAPVNCPNVRSNRQVSKPTPMEISTKSPRAGPDVSKFVVKSKISFHNFFRETPCSHEQNSLLLRTLHKEFKKLKNELNEGIYVIGYEERMDLFSVILIGSEETPFEDFIFFFEVFIPSEYPDRPPQIFYRDFAQIGILPNWVDQKFEFDVDKLFGKKWEPIGLVGVFNSMKEHIFVKEPLYSRGSEVRAKIRGTPNGDALSRSFNERLIIQLVKGTEKWENSYSHLTEWHPELIQLSKHYSARMMETVLEWSKGTKYPDFPLKVVSPTFTTQMTKFLPTLADKLSKLNFNADDKA